MNEIAAFTSPGSAASVLLCLVAGFLAWSLVEYCVHGVLAHRFETFVTPLHWGHHREPRAVFTSPLAWVPVALLLAGALGATLGPLLGGAAWLGLLAGFARYERTHWRIHFREPRNKSEQLRRNHHLAHHFGRPDQYHGVTTRFWDRVVGTLPTSWPEDYARASQRAPLEGPSNWGVIWRGRLMGRPTRP
jgi:sterol desaturase/sphingolipid hydroxylase (fatty acid hydroxylase superfamily)